jgi:hypothetical protein
MTAMKSNRHVPAYLLGRKKIPRSLPDYNGLATIARRPCTPSMETPHGRAHQALWIGWGDGHHCSSLRPITPALHRQIPDRTAGCRVPARQPA